MKSIRPAVIAAVFALAGAISVPAAAQQLTGGGSHTCAIVANGDVYCFGRNIEGQVGDGSVDGSIALPRKAALANATVIDAGGQHTCAIANAGEVHCWGYNRWGQIGVAVGPRTPVRVLGLPAAAVDVAAGGNHSCAALVDGSVWCWGHGYQGELGNGVYTETYVPDQADGVSGATAVAAGGNHTCAVVTGGAVKCWGRNHVGQLGNGSSQSDPGVFNAVDVSGVTDAIDIAAGDAFTCALIQGGTIECWGHGGYGSLGNDAFANSAFAVGVVGITDAVALDVGGAHSCALLGSGGVACWGHNYYGQIGDGTNRNNWSVARGASGVAGASAVAAGGEFGCARTQASPINVMCWGHGTFGELGDDQLGGAHENPWPHHVLGSFDVIFGLEPGSFE